MHETCNFLVHVHCSVSFGIFSTLRVFLVLARVFFNRHQFGKEKVRSYGLLLTTAFGNGKFKGIN